MSRDLSDKRRGDVRDRIAAFMQADRQARRKGVAQKDAQAFRAAADRLDRLLREFADAEEARREEELEQEARALRAAACRLDRLLGGIAGKQAMPELKLRCQEKESTEWLPAWLSAGCRPALRQKARAHHPLQCARTLKCAPM
jgi:hypothetical protein